MIEPGVVTGFLGPNGAGKPVTGLGHSFVSRGQVADRVRPVRGTGKLGCEP